MTLRILSGLDEGQVLQRRGERGADARLAGTSTVDGVVYASIRRADGTSLRGWRRRRAGQAGEGAFAVELAGIPVGGPYRLTLECGEARTRGRGFYVGDVWLLAGQSNMEGCGQMALGKARPHPLIRAFSLRREWRRAEDPLHVPWESPDAALNEGKPFTPEEAEAYRRAARRGVGVGVFFAREMLARSGVPQGLICAARGATQMAQWCPDAKSPAAGALYASMLRSLRATGQPVAGVLWYQGEGDSAADRAALYTSRMRRLIAATRRDLGQPELPWMIGQLSRVYGERKETAWNSVQEQQRRLAARIRCAALVATVDLPLDDFIHLGAEAFPRLAKRFARAADRLVHGNREEPPPPSLRAVSGLRKDAAGEAGWIDVAFADVVGGLHASGLPLGFVLLDAKGRPVPALYKTTLHGAIARLHVLPEYPGTGLWVAYGHGNAPACNIVDGRDCPLPVFAARRVAGARRGRGVARVAQ